MRAVSEVEDLHLTLGNAALLTIGRISYLLVRFEAEYRAYIEGLGWFTGTAAEVSAKVRGATAEKLVARRAAAATQGLSPLPGGDCPHQSPVSGSRLGVQPLTAGV